MEKTQSLKEREFDVLCVGLAVGNVVVRPVSPDVFVRETTQVKAIEMLGGGDAFNQSSVLSALGHKAALVTKMADDEFGNIMRGYLRRRGIEESLIAVDTELKTSSCVVLIQENGQRTFCTYKGCLRTFGEDDIDFRAVSRAKIVSIGGLFAMPAFDQTASVKLFKAAREAGTITVADTKYDAFHIGFEGIRGLLPHTDYFFPSYEEASYLSGKTDPENIAAFFSDAGAANVGIKLGGKGCYLHTPHFKGSIPTFPGEVLDTTGAGDNFMSGFIHGLLGGWDITDCALYANAVGTLAVSRLGATSDEEYPEHVKEILLRTTEGKDLLKKVDKKWN